MRVNDEFVQLAAPAVLKCRIQSALANQLASLHQKRLLVEWFTSDGFQVAPAELTRGKSRPALALTGHTLITAPAGIVLRARAAPEVQRWAARARQANELSRSR